MKNIDLMRVNQLVLRKHHLTEETKSADIIQIVKDIGGLHATGATVPYLSLFARTRTFVKEDLAEELYEKRNLGKIRCMRKTIYIQPKEIIPIVHTATRQMVEKASKRYAEFRGISSEKYEESSKAILNLLKESEMTASEIKKVLKTKLDVSAILYLMCDQGMLIRGRPVKGWKDKRHKYALFSDYFPIIDLTNVKEREAITQLVQQYLKAFGPVTETDIVWWTGLSKTKVRDALNQLQARIEHIEISNLPGDFMLFQSDRTLIEKLGPSDQTVNLLPSLDPYLMGYKERERYLHPNHYDNVFDRSGNATSTILLEGRVVGVWDIIEAVKPTMKLFLFKEVEGRVFKKIYTMAQKLGRFMIEKDVQIKECDSMVSLTRRSAGGFMTPLKGC